jgi:catechol 2,3-dioxygenase-like lactoylglutathione lyase family enzyme
MLSHVYVGAKKFGRAFEFYRAVLPILGWAPRFHEEEAGWAGWQPGDGSDRPLFLVGRPYDGKPAAPGNGQMVALLAPSRATVVEAYKTALANGATSEGPPGLRPHYHPHYFGAYFRDTEGNKICICCHRSEG